ncbi:MAG: hypothetical protein ABJO09_07625 [Hyphomicrobiales bacterium]
MLNITSMMLGIGAGLLAGLVIGVIAGFIFGQANRYTDFCADYQSANYIENASAREDACR